MNTPKLFLTDYGSYNNGSQFEFGHWVDLSDFSDADDLMEYVQKHFKECDEKSPLPDGGPREETMWTDCEDLPDFLYGESIWGDDLRRIYAYMGLIEEYDLDDEGTLLSLHNEMCQEERNGEGVIYENDDDTLVMLFGTNILDAIRAAVYGNYNMGSDYMCFDGYASLESIHNLESYIDKEEVIQWKLGQSI
jgi:hypothetical protein